MNDRMLTMFRLPALAVALTFTLAACDDLTDIEEHLEAAGFIVVVDGTERVRHMDSDNTTPTLSLAAGAVYEVEIALLDEDGNELPAEHEDDGEHEDELAVTILDTQYATWTAEAHDGGEEPEHVAAHGELETLTAGSTTVQLCLEHEGHCDYETTFTLEVTDQGT